MSIFISNDNINTIYLYSKDILTHDNCYREPRQYEKMLPVYLASRKNFAYDSLNRKHEYALFQKTFNQFCCLNCLRYIPGDIRVCKKCYYFYCKECYDIVRTDDSCTFCN